MPVSVQMAGPDDISLIRLRKEVVLIPGRIAPVGSRLGRHNS